MSGLVKIRAPGGSRPQTIGRKKSPRRFSQNDVPGVTNPKEFFSRVIPGESGIKTGKKKIEEECFAMRVQNKQLTDTIKNTKRNFNKGSSNSISLRSSANIIGGAISKLPNSSTVGSSKLYVRLIPQPAPRGYPQRWTSVLFDPFPESEKKLQTQCNSYGYALAVLRGSNFVHLSSIVVIIPIDNVTMEREGDMTIKISQNSSNVSRDEFTFKLVSEKQKESWFQVIERECNAHPLPTVEFFPVHYDTYSDTSVLSASSLLSSSVQYSEVIEYTGEGEEISVFEFQAAPVVDFMEMALLQSKENTSVLMIDIVILYHIMNDNAFSDFYRALKGTWKNHVIARRKGYSNASCYDWKDKLRCFGEHISRAYSLLSLRDRDRIVRFCEKELSAESCSVMRNNLSNYLLNETSSELLSLHQTISVHPEWEVQDDPVLLNYPSRSIAEQITLLEALHHKQIKISDLFKSTKSLAPDSALKLAANWWNKISFWVAEEILQQASPKAQYQRMKKFLKIARICFQMRNYSSCAQLIAGINHNAVQRLRKLREIIPPKLQESIDTLSNIFSHRENYRAYRTLLPHESPYLCFLPVFQRDIIYILDGNTSHSDDLVNVDRLKMLAEVLHKTGFLHPKYHFEFPHKRDSAMVSLLLSSQVTEDELYVLSERREPNRGLLEDEPEENHEVRTTVNPLHGDTNLRQFLSSPKHKKRRRSSSTFV